VLGRGLLTDKCRSVNSDGGLHVVGDGFLVTRDQHQVGPCCQIEWVGELVPARVRLDRLGCEERFCVVQLATGGQGCSSGCAQLGTQPVGFDPGLVGLLGQLG
jgi:hypothetical protein